MSMYAEMLEASGGNVFDSRRTTIPQMKSVVAPHRGFRFRLNSTGAVSQFQNPPAICDVNFNEFPEQASRGLTRRYFKEIAEIAAQGYSGPHFVILFSIR